MMESVENNQGMDDPSEVDTIIGSPAAQHDVDDDLGGEDDSPSSLYSRAPSTQRVINEVKTRKEVKMCVSHSPIFDDTNQHLLFQVGLWKVFVQSSQW